MVNTKSKGRKHEKEAMAVYEGWGYKVWAPANSSRAIGPGKFISESQDIFECFDFVAANEHNLHLVQVKTWDKSEAEPAKARKKIDALGFKWCANLVVMARLPRKPGRFVMWRYEPDQKVWVRFNCMEDF